MRKRVIFFTILLAVSCHSDRDKAIKAEIESLQNCAQMINSGIRPIAGTREERFQGKVENATAVCRGGGVAAQVPPRRGWIGPTTGELAGPRPKRPISSSRLVISARMIAASMAR